MHPLSTFLCLTQMIIECTTESIYNVKWTNKHFERKIRWRNLLGCWANRLGLDSAANLDSGVNECLLESLLVLWGVIGTFTTS
jgi:hypothetical protein